MKLSKKFIELIEKEDNELGDILLAMMDEPDNTREDITATATEFLMASSDYDGNVLELNKFVVLNILDDDEEDDEEDLSVDEDSVVSTYSEEPDEDEEGYPEEDQEDDID